MILGIPAIWKEYNPFALENDPLPLPTIPSVDI